MSETQKQILAMNKAQRDLSSHTPTTSIAQKATGRSDVYILEKEQRKEYFIGKRKSNKVLKVRESHV